MADVHGVIRWRRLDSWAPPLADVRVGDWREVRIGEVVSLIKPTAYSPESTEIVRFAGVRWYGNGLYVREERLGRDIAGKAYPLKPGALVYNRLFGWKKAFAEVGPAYAGVMVSAEFPQFEVDPAMATSAFLKLAFTMDEFAARVMAKSTGSTAVSRNRLRENEFLNLTIPLPPLARQNDIVRSFHAAHSTAGHLRREVAGMRRNAERDFLSGLGYEQTDEQPDSHRSGFITSFRLLDRWDVEAGGRVPHTKDRIGSRYPQAALSDCASIALGAQVPGKNDGLGTGYRYLRAKNVQRGFFDLSDVGRMPLSQGQLDRLSLCPGDLLFVEGNSQEEVGRAAVWNGDDPEEYVIQNSIVRARPDLTRLNPWFACAWFNSAAGRRYFWDNATSTTGTLFHIGAGKTASAPLPLPGLEVQAKLADEYWDAWSSAAEKSARADKMVHEAATEAETAIFGQADDGDADSASTSINGVA